MLQTLVSYTTLLARVPNVSSLGIGRFIFSSPFEEFLNNSIDVRNEDVLYNWTDKVSMSISKASRPFKVPKEMYPSTIQALINVCSKIKSFVADLSTSTHICYFSKKLSYHISPYRQHSQGLSKPWAPHPSFGVRYGGFYKGVRAFH
jgi:hypothetical protein